MESTHPRQEMTWLVMAPDPRARQFVEQLLRDAGLMVASRPPSDALPGLVIGSSDITPCELVVLRALTVVSTSRRIAESLGVSPRTVDHHIENLKRKLGVKSRACLVARAVDLGLLYKNSSARL
jgi:DNA-binding NarL/FixJ family response regulator